MSNKTKLSLVLTVALSLSAISFIVTSCTAKTDAPWLDVLVEANELRLKGDYDAALKKAEAACKLAEELPSPLCPTLASDNQIARILDEQGKFAEEEQALQRAIARGDQSDFIARVGDLRLQSFLKLMAIYEFTDRSKKGEGLVVPVRTLESALATFGSQYRRPNFEALDAKAKIEKRQQSGEEQRLLTKAINNTKRLTIDDEASTREACAHVYFNLGKADEAYREFKRAMALRGVMGPRSEVDGLVAQMDILAAVGRKNEAQEKAHQAEALAARLPALVEAEILNRIGRFYMYSGDDRAQAKRLWERVSSIQDWSLAHNDPAKVDVLGKRALLCAQTNPKNVDEVRSLYEKAFSIATTADVLETSQTKEMLANYMTFLRDNQDKTSADKLQAEINSRESSLQQRHKKRLEIPQEAREKYWYEYAWNLVKKIRATKQDPGFLQRYPIMKVQVDSDGTIYEPKLMQSSDDIALDKFAGKVLLSLSPLPKLPEWSSRYIVLTLTYDDKLYSEARSQLALPASIQIEETDEQLTLAPAMPAQSIYWSAKPIQKGKPFEKGSLKVLQTESFLLPFTSLSQKAAIEGRIADDNIVSHQPIVLSDVHPEAKK